MNFNSLVFCTARVKAKFSLDIISKPNSLKNIFSISGAFNVMKNSNLFERLLQIGSILGLMLLASSGTNAQGLPGSPGHAVATARNAFDLCVRAEFELRFIPGIGPLVQKIQRLYARDYQGISNEALQTDKIVTNSCPTRHPSVTVHEAELPGGGSAFSITVEGMTKEQCKKYVAHARSLVNSHEALYINEASIPYDLKVTADDLGRNHCVQSRNKVAMTLQ
jgi:hypothetical protein